MSSINVNMQAITQEVDELIMLKTAGVEEDQLAGRVQAVSKQILDAQNNVLIAIANGDQSLEKISIKLNQLGTTLEQFQSPKVDSSEKVMSYEHDKIRLEGYMKIIKEGKGDTSAALKSAKAKLSTMENNHPDKTAELAKYRALLFPQQANRVTSSTTGTQATTTVAPASDREVEEAVNITNILSIAMYDPLGKAQKRSAENVFRLNPNLCRAVNENMQGMTTEDAFIFFTGDEIPVHAQCVQGICQGFQPQASRTHFQLQGHGQGFYAGTIADGLNPADDLEVVLNLTPGAHVLENVRAGLDYRTYDLADSQTIDAHGKAQLKQSVLDACDRIRNGQRVMGHCTEGKNRTGIWATLVIAVIENKDFDTAWNKFYTVRGQGLHARPSDAYIAAGREILAEIQAGNRGPA